MPPGGVRPIAYSACHYISFLPRSVLGSDNLIIFKRIEVRIRYCIASKVPADFDSYQAITVSDGFPH